MQKLLFISILTVALMAFPSIPVRPQVNTKGLINENIKAVHLMPDNLMPGSKCRITRMTGNMGDTLRFCYDTLGRVQRIYETGGQVTQFDYYSNIIIATETRKDSIAYKRLITLQAGDGMVSNLFEESYQGGTPHWTYRSYAYDGHLLTGTTTVNSNRATPLQTRLVWTHGNFTTEKGSEGGDVKFEYYEDKAARPGGYWYINVLPAIGMTGNLYRNKNLLKTIRYGNSISAISYEFDPSGKITAMSVATKGNIKKWRYEYDPNCN